MEAAEGPGFGKVTLHVTLPLGQTMELSLVSTDATKSFTVHETVTPAPVATTASEAG